MRQRLFKTFAVAVLVGTIAGLITVYAQNAVRQQVEAQRFVLVDESGKRRGEWAIDSNGQTFLRFFDEQGKIVWDTRPRIMPLRPSTQD